MVSPEFSNIEQQFPFEMANTQLFLLFVLVAIAVCQKDFAKVIHNTDPQAKCLDGSPAMVYLHQGGDTHNILFHFLGGGACLGSDLSQTLEQCYQRSKGALGSSSKLPDVFHGQDAGILSTDPAKSAFANWTKIIITYCDGAFHQGNNLKPIQYKDASLYFRGGVNTRSHFKWADNKYGLAAANKIVISGQSAGGMAVYLWYQYVIDLVGDASKVYAVADSSIFYDPLVSHIHPEQIFQILESNVLSSQPANDDPNPVEILMQLSNTDERPPNKECSNLLTQEEQWKCIFIQFSYPTLKETILFVESSYDAFIIRNVLKFQCLKKGTSGETPKDCADWQMDVIQLYRSFYLERFLPKLLKYGHSIWTISCVWHSKISTGSIYDSPLQKVPKNDGRTMRNATEAYVFDRKRIEAIDLFPWPANTPCAY